MLFISTVLSHFPVLSVRFCFLYSQTITTDGSDFYLDNAQLFDIPNPFDIFGTGEVILSSNSGFTVSYKANEWQVIGVLLNIYTCIGVCIRILIFQLHLR